MTTNSNIDKLKHLKESEDHVEFKAARHNYPFAGGNHNDPRERRRCVLGYIVALANECGGCLVLGMEDARPHNVCGSDFAQGETGNLEAAIYKTLGIRVQTREEYEEDKRVLIIEIPSRPVGRLLKFEGVPLMRVGEELHEMSDAQMLKILSEQEPDFSAKVCEGLTITDLDGEAVKVLKSKYADKQKNPSFKNMPDDQVLRDLELLVDGKLNYAALMLLGKADVIHRLLPQYEIIVEYRRSKASIQYNARKEFVLPLFLGVYKVWDYLNQPLSNPEDHLRIGPDMHDIQAFNEDCIREGILNALAHRSLQMVSSVVIKQSPDELTIVNPGGFPLGVNVDNILTVSSNPRQKRVAEVLEKTGLVERSGQGVDKMFANCIRDGKLLPSFDGTDDYQVCLTFFSKIRYPKLARLVRSQQELRDEEDALTIFELMGLYRIDNGESEAVQSNVIEQLKKEKLIVPVGGSWEIIGGNDTANDPLDDPLDDPLGNAANNIDNKLTKRQMRLRWLIEGNSSMTREELSRKVKVSVATVKRDLKVIGFHWEGSSTAGHWVKD